MRVKFLKQNKMNITSKKKMNLTFDNVDILSKLINDVYFTSENGKKNISANKTIKIPSDNIYYKILSNLDYNIKLSNEIIDGYMIFKMSENKEKKYILLYPESIYCIEKEGKYVFY